MSRAPRSVRAEAARLVTRFTDAGATQVEADILQPADLLLDLYGEDIRARAFTTWDPLRGERVLRPDFTVPVLRAHIEAGGGAASYAYAGEVFRRQEDDPDRPVEYLQTGFERLGGGDPEAADAEVFALFREALAPFGLRAVTGDMGILLAAVDGLATTPARKAALRRHIWRPRRFRRLIERFAGQAALPPGRAALLASRAPGAPGGSAVASGPVGPVIGKRSAAEVAARVDALRADAAEPALGQREVDLLDDLLSLRDTAAAAHGRLSDLAVDLPALGAAVDRFARRLDALAANGIDVDTLPFEASYGRTSLEYYDGFVFGLVSDAHPDWSPVASGGRYDALVRALGGTDPAVGGVVRPGLVAVLAGEGGPWS